MEKFEASSEIGAHSRELRTTVAYWRSLHHAMPKSTYRNNNMYNAINAQTAFDVMSPADQTAHIASISPNSSLSASQHAAKK
jgi:hypothetical protein